MPPPPFSGGCALMLNFSPAMLARRGQERAIPKRWRLSFAEACRWQLAGATQCRRSPLPMRPGAHAAKVKTSLHRVIEEPAKVPDELSPSQASKQQVFGRADHLKQENRHMKSYQTFLAAAALIVLPLAGGCTTYYRVADPSTGKVYYTTKVLEKDGSTQLVDAKTKAKVTIQNSEVTKVKKSEYDAARK